MSHGTQLNKTAMSLNLNVRMEEPSKVTRKLTITVPSDSITTQMDQQLKEVQKQARIKGFRPGHVPLNVVRQYYGPDIKNRVLNRLIDESYRQAVIQEKLRPVSQPEIDLGGKDPLQLLEGADLTYTATVDVMPEIEIKSYKGIGLKKESVSVTDEDVENVIKGIREQSAHVESLPEEEAKGRKVAQKDHVDITFKGGLVTDAGVEEKPGMSGSRLLEIGSKSLIDGFEEQLVGMTLGETKTFRIPFPADYHDKDFASKDAEFTVTIDSMKKKILPELNDDFAKESGYESMTDMRTKAKDAMTRHKTEEADQKLKNELLNILIEKNAFEVPNSLVQAQARSVAQDFGMNLKRQGFDDGMVQDAIQRELENIQKKAETQVRIGLLLDSISSKENIAIDDAEIDAEIKLMAQSMNMPEDKVKGFYTKRENRENLMFRLKEEKTVKFLFDQAKIK